MFGVGDMQHDTESVPHWDSLNRIELQESKRTMLAGLSVGVFETDDEGEYVWVNREYLRMTGRAPDEVKGSGWIESVAPQDLSRVVQEWNAAINEERECKFEYTLVSCDEDVQVCARTYKMDNGFLGMLTPM